MAWPERVALPVVGKRQEAAMTARRRFLAASVAASVSTAMVQADQLRQAWASPACRPASAWA